MSVNIKDLELPVTGAFFWKRVKLEKIAEDFIDKVIEIAEYAGNNADSESLESCSSNFFNYYYGIVGSLENHCLPFWWTDFFNVENELKSLVSQLIIYSNNINYIEKTTPFEKMIEREILILKDIKNFFKGMVSGKEEVVSVKESFINHGKEYSEILRGAVSEEENKQSGILYFPVINIFERIRKTNENILESLGKITMGAAV